MPSNAAQLALAACYYAVSLICGFQTATIAYHGHQLRSFRVGFLLLSLTWTALKGVFWLDVEGWTLLEWVLFSKLPTCGQMASYLFFLIFCAQQVHRRSWAEKHSRRCWLFFAAANLASLGSVVGFTVLALVAGNGGAGGGSGSAATAEQQEETTLGLIFSATVYTILGASLAMYGWLIWARNTPSPTTSAAAAAAAAAGSKRVSGAETAPAPPTQVSFKTGFVKKDERVSGIVPVLVAVRAACHPPQSVRLPLTPTAAAPPLSCLRTNLLLIYS